MKKILMLLLIVLVVIRGSNVQAKRGVAYQVGDLITVKINSTETRPFYVIENSGATSNTVTAISKDFLGSPVSYHEKVAEGCYISTSYEDSYIKQVVDSRTSTWTNAISVSLLSIAQIEALVGTSIVDPDAIVSYRVNANLPITSTAKYWTMSRATFQRNESECDVWFVDGRDVSQSTGCTANEVRPVIVVDKDNIVDEPTNPNLPDEPTEPTNPNPPTDSTEPTNPQAPQETDNVTNPKTGLYSSYIIGGISILGVIGAIILFKKRNYFEKI